MVRAPLHQAPIMRSNGRAAGWAGYLGCRCRKLLHQPSSEAAPQLQQFHQQQQVLWQHLGLGQEWQRVG